MKARRAGINPKKIVFSGVGKTIKEINFAINNNILLINAESKSEIIEIERSSQRAKVKGINMIKKHLKTTKEKKEG